MATRTINWRWSSRAERDSFRQDEIDCNPAPFERRRIQLSGKLGWRLTQWFGAAVIVLGLAAIFLSYLVLPGVLRRHAIETSRLGVVPTTVSAADGVAAPVKLRSVSIVPDIDRTCVAITLLILAAMVLTIAAASVVFNWMARPLVDLIERAENMSLGALGVPIMVSGTDAVAKLGGSLERIRRLLHAAIRRLNSEHNLGLPAGARRLSLPPASHSPHP